MQLKVKPFKSSLSYSPQEINNVLQSKIEEENLIVENNSTSEAKHFDLELLKTVNYIPGKLNILSLFSGAGGLDLGIQMAHATTKYGIEKSYTKINKKEEFNKLLTDIKIIYSNDSYKLANETYLNNFDSSMVKDSRDIREIINFPKSNLILGGFPCPGFSASGPRLLDDPRNFLYIHYIRALIQSQPSFFIAENVKGLMTMANGHVLSQMKEDFSAAGYQVTAYLVNARDYGVPQNRERVFIIGVRKDVVYKYGFKYNLPDATHGSMKIPYLTLRDAIGDLPLNPDDVFFSDYSSMYMSRNRKKHWDEQSFTIQASGRQAPQHPAGEPMKRIDKDLWKFEGDFNRRLSVRECARIQTFPDWFTFSHSSKQNISKNSILNDQYKQIGNAVPVILAEKISRPIIEFLYQHQELLK
ncbi:DNA cytosine methyltransferase [Mammaliicoccus sciuri]|uniref:DNA cytosine methyltransferase n=1 Tax=Mammaliicoccus sciuri TaxID=1296 RepID=UPI001FB50F32|nr:DNA cytosine methyltransferase [Mammaliicoccus sciuri]MCJ0916138.1 DNA cytosine methyltransferase [Mammaliicoccus sciuri]MCJ0936841.1 DNA cytosine methyltransferase [Mammaliicoccus sciuri]